MLQIAEHGHRDTGDDLAQLLSLSSRPWLLRRAGFSKDPRRLQINETLMTIGNGYLNIRGSLEELPEGSCRGMYINGVYDRSEADVEELVKCPVWTDVSVWIDGLKISPATCRVLRHEQVLDMKKGILHRVSRLRTPSGKILTLSTVKLVCFHAVHHGYMRVSVLAENFSGNIRVLSGLNGDVFNRGFFEGERLKHLHLERIERGRNLMYLEMKTRERQIHIAHAASWRMLDGQSRNVRWEPRIYGEKFASEMTLSAEKGSLSEFEKFAVVMTSREVKKECMFSESVRELKSFLRKGAFQEIQEHISQWDECWKQADITIEGDCEAQEAIRYNIYQLLINGPRTVGSVGAKFLSSEGYLGHVFWDTEIFVFPFYLYNFPSMARNMLLYRYETLPGALLNAERAGYRGARYGWETATTGEDVTPRFASKLERTIRLIYTGVEEEHIVSDVIYALERYVRVTGDMDFLRQCGLEMIFLTARYWASRVWKEGDGYEIHTVIGPDEFHEHVNNNAYTNFLVRWHLRLAAIVFRHFSRTGDKGFMRVCRNLDLKSTEVSRWSEISRSLKFGIDSDTLLIEQFDGYFSLSDHGVRRHDRKGRPVLPAGITYRTIGKTRLIKQADVLMLFLLFPHSFSPEVKQANYDFYEPRTLHKSSLSHSAHAMVGLDIGDHQHAYRYFMKTVRVDLDNLHGNTDLGIHAAAVGGAWQTVVMGFGGLTLKSDRIVLNPWLPGSWRRLVFRVQWRERIIELDISHEQTLIRIVASREMIVPCTFRNRCFRIRSNIRYVLRDRPLSCSIGED
ncbi:kojibiose phosphorylase [Prosthecochloris sp. ZM]|uniref:glycoside hydrolase family 65 protein n=1 Tax=Prosthecochloris sp. ZM TaxID=2283143 RepID=UPI000DF84481|nr:glycosyl hydrolase family 65 protein [Prosthecochloris sp. ZM]RDD30522.1 kojibiose phosphorylase [Prosthecochloris sp. ZM]